MSRSSSPKGRDCVCWVTLFCDTADGKHRLHHLAMNPGSASSSDSYTKSGGASSYVNSDVDRSDILLVRDRDSGAVFGAKCCSSVLYELGLKFLPKFQNLLFCFLKLS